MPQPLISNFTLSSHSFPPAVELRSANYVDLLSTNQFRWAAARSQFIQKRIDSFFDEDVRKVYFRVSHFNSPLFPDINRDHAVDYFYNNHYAFYPEGGICPYMVYSTKCSSMVYGKFMQNGVLGPLAVDFSLTDKYFRSYDMYDSHGSAILDIDGDGFLDLYLNAGGGRGLGRGMGFASTVYWGSQNKIKYADWTIVGGSEAAMAAGLENIGGTGRGRSVYFADFNGDGRLDVLLVNEQRVDTFFAPSQLLYNIGNRKFKKDSKFMEYIKIVIFGNLFGNKHAPARDIIIQRDSCLPNGTAHNAFCRRHISYSWASYSYSSIEKRMVKKFDTKIPIKDVSGCKNIEVADINEDGIMDFFLSTKDRIQFFYSSEKYSKIISLEGASEEILPPSNYKLGIATMQDFDLDGGLKVVAVYYNEEQKKHKTVMYSRREGVSKAPFWKVFHSKDNFPVVEGQFSSKFNDIAAVDYNNDGFKDIVVVNHYALYHLVSEPLYTPTYLAVVLHGKGYVNKYGIGSSLKMKVYNKKKKQIEYHLKSVNTYSHGTTEHGGAVDHRNVFGLGYTSTPLHLSIVW
mmetsp:Transcript_603/g.1185  ORF Transcript_603/g.1185 Transcript_603/m.1185 type:complete len:572 (+) Transcript_603:44-1759(+)